MGADAIYHVWAPSDSNWSRWITPALFALMRSHETAPYVPAKNPFADQPLPWVPNTNENVLIVIDLPGSDSVWLALELARRGYRPVPIINAATGPWAVVDVDRIHQAVREATSVLPSLMIADNAPPVFFLDANRMTGYPLPNRFDNRWIVFPQDFPSGNFLASKGIQKVHLIQQVNGQPQTDLAHVLLRWQEAGLTIHVNGTDELESPRLLTITKPPRYKKLWYRALALFGLRRNSAGGFGDVVPDPDESSGFG